MRTQTLLAFAILLIGVGNLCILPPFEGFDETSHYSSIRQIAETGTIPVFGQDTLSRDVVDYRQHGPMPYTSLTPPFTHNGGMTYAEFFARPDLIPQYIHAYRQSSRPELFEPSKEMNWEAQHPPLYYLLMAPLMKMMDSMPLVSQLFALRLVSFVLALAGLMIGLRGSLIYCVTPMTRNYMVAGFLLYPLMVPMFFPEFARLGSDSLCLFLMGVFWAVLLRWLHSEGNWKLTIGLGICLGFGLLTKGLFLPIALGFGLFLSLRVWRSRGDRALFLSRLQNLALIVAVALLLAGWWYLRKLTAHVSLGGDEYIALTHGTEWLEKVRSGFTLSAFMHGIAVMVASWSWGGTWSLVRIADVLRLPVLALVAWLFIEYLREAWQQPLTEPIWLVTWLCAPFLGGLMLHVLLVMALSGAGGTPGWYLNVLAPALAMAFAHGLARAAARPRTRFILGGLLFYDVAFLCVASWAQATLFAGCATKGIIKYYEFADHAACLGRIPNVLSNLETLGWPFLGVFAFGGGILSFTLGFAKLLTGSEPKTK